ncbi:MAG: hypothetical protein HOV81_13930 [Kofleriaceae bacterium]|nr:hypothetical protein [Kofleriaceae bacterium]
MTRFAHVYYVPLFPVAAMWITREGFGHSMKLSGRSVLAGYARTWGPLAALAGLMTGGVGGVGIAAASLALTAWSWMWKDVRTPTAQRRSDLNARAFGTRCEPKLLPSDVATALEAELKQRWAVVSDGQSPSDVARFGTDDVHKAAAAYGVLRLSARQLRGAQAAEAERDASRIAEGIRDLQISEGPYRSSAIAGLLAPEQSPKQ